MQAAEGEGRIARVRVYAVPQGVLPPTDENGGGVDVFTGHRAQSLWQGNSVPEQNPTPLSHRGQTGNEQKGL